MKTAVYFRWNATVYFGNISSLVLLESHFAEYRFKNYHIWTFSQPY